MNIIEKFNFKLLKQTLGYMNKRKFMFIIICLSFNLMDAVSTVINTYGLKGVINGLTNYNYSLFCHSMFLIILRIFIWLIYTPICSYLCDWSSKHGIYSLNNELSYHIIRQPLSKIESKPVGEYISVLSNDINGVQSIYDGGLSALIGNVVSGIIGLLTMFAIDWRFAIVVIAFGTINLVVSAFTSEKLSSEGAKLQQQLASNSTEIHSQIAAAKTIRLMFIQNQIKQNYGMAVDKETDIKKRLGFASVKMSTLQTLINLVCSMMILIVGAILVNYKLTDWGTVVALTGLKASADMLFSGVGSSLANMQGNLQGSQRCQDIFEQPLENLEDSQAHYYLKPILSDAKEILNISGLTFRYSNHLPPILNNINLTLKKGELVVLLGQNGCGKTTLLKLIMSLYTPSNGTISYKSHTDGPASLLNIRDKIAYVSQDTLLMRDTIYNNLLLGNESASLDDVIRAAKLAEADAFIQNLPNGYDYYLTDYGRNLSGGQRQRIAIARALLKNAPILLCDEITSALDHETEEKIIETLYRLKENYAILYITHQPDIVRKADRVVYMENLINREPATPISNRIEP